MLDSEEITHTLTFIYYQIILSNIITHRLYFLYSTSILPYSSKFISRKLTRLTQLVNFNNYKQFNHLPFKLSQCESIINWRYCAMFAVFREI